MRKQPMLRSLLFLIMAALWAVASGAEDKYPELTGSWHYAATEAPFEYSKGRLILEDNNGELEGVVKIGDASIGIQNVKYKKHRLDFTAYVEGTIVNVSLHFDQGKFTGKASYSEGVVSISGEREIVEQ